jgi:hypothetical protein
MKVVLIRVKRVLGIKRKRRRRREMRIYLMRVLNLPKKRLPKRLSLRRRN